MSVFVAQTSARAWAENSAEQLSKDYQSIFDVAEPVGASTDLLNGMSPG